MAVQTQIQVRRGTASSWTSTNPTLAAGEIGFESDTGKIKVGTGSATWNSLTYIGAANAIQYVYTATAGQTTFSGVDSNGLTLSYTVGAEQVYVNGVLQVRGTDYTATNGTSVVLTSAALVSDIITVIAYGTFTVADTYTQAQANATFPLNTSSFFAGKNKIINGDMNIWQRGTSYTVGNTGPYYGAADRWRYYHNGATAGTNTVSRQAFTVGQTDVPNNPTYFQRWTATTLGTSQTVVDFDQLIEDVSTFAGQTVTISFYVKASAAFGYTIYLEQNFGSGGSASVGTTMASGNTSTSWVKVTGTATLPSISGKTVGTGSSLRFLIRFSNPTAGATFDIANAQVEAGSVATAFQTATGTIQGELAACQRYYYRWTSTIDAHYGTGFGISTTAAYIQFALPVPMRTAVSSIETNQFYIGNGATYYSTGSWTVARNNNLSPTLQYGSSSSITQNNFYMGYGTGGSSYIGFNAEL